MKRSMLLGLVLGALACGSSEQSTAPVSAGQPQEPRQLVEEKPGTWKESPTPAASDEEASQEEVSVHPSVTSCLGLVKESRWAEAVAPCTEAARNAPGNREVSAALARAKQEAAAEATARATGALQEATGTATEAAEDSSASLQEKAVESLPSGLR